MLFTLLILWMAVADGFFFPPTVSLPKTGQTVSLFGKGPPVVFSSGLFGTMPRRIYTQLFESLTQNMTIVVLNEASPVRADTVESIAESLRVDQVGFLSHSSIDLGILESERVRSAVLCDPVALPRLEVPGFQLKPPEVHREVPCLVLRASKAYEDSDVPLPEYLMPTFPPGMVTEKVIHGVGHADLLDNPWAEIGTRALPWMRGVVPDSKTYSEWDYEPRAGAHVRDKYRRKVASLAAEHLLQGVAQPTRMITESAPEE